jgi:hypothetical protein
MAQKHGFTGFGGLKLRTEAGVVYYLWVDSTGDLRISSTKPTTFDSDGTVVGTQS